VVCDFCKDEGVIDVMDLLTNKRHSTRCNCAGDAYFKDKRTLESYFLGFGYIPLGFDFSMPIFSADEKFKIQEERDKRHKFYAAEIDEILKKLVSKVS